MINNEFICDCEVIHADLVEKVKLKMPDEDELYDLADFFNLKETDYQRLGLSPLAIRSILRPDWPSIEAELAWVQKASMKHSIKAWMNLKRITFSSSGKRVNLLQQEGRKGQQAKAMFGWATSSARWNMPMRLPTW